MKIRTKLKLTGVLIIFLAVGAAYVSVRFYPYLFGPSVVGEVVAIEKYPPTADAGYTDGDPMHLHAPSYSLAIRAGDGQVFTVTTKDRQWALVNKGDCVRARLFAFPFWDQERSGTYFGARLKGLRKGCQGPAA